MHEPQIRESLCAPTFLGHHVMQMEPLAIVQVLVTDGTVAVLSLDELPATRISHVRLGSSLSPVALRGRVIGGIRRWHEPMPDNLGPGKFPERRLAVFILKDPPVLTTRVLKVGGSEDNGGRFKPRDDWQRAAASGHRG